MNYLSKLLLVAALMGAASVSVAQDKPQAPKARKKANKAKERPSVASKPLPNPHVILPPDDNVKEVEIPVKGIEDEVELFAVEQQPEFPGGAEAMDKFIGDNIKNPLAAVKAKVQGVVYVSILVPKDGTLSELIVTKGIGFGCDEEAVRVVSSMPPWKPAIINGKNVKVRMQIPIRFKLSS